MTSETREIGLALLGLGNVGAGVIKLLEENAAAIEARLGARIVIRAIAVRAIDKKRLVEVDKALLTTDLAATIRRPDVDIVCELIGGEEEARAAVLGAIGHVNLVVLFEQDTPVELIELLHPDLLVKGADYKVEEIVGADVVQKAGGRVMTVDLVPGQSTTRLIASGKVRA